MTEDIIYVQLLNEGTVCYRPVPATRTDDGTYILGGEDLYDREDEVWEFAPGTRVHVEKRLLSGGMTMVATAIYACALCRQREVVERGRDRWCAFCRQREMEDRHKQPTVSQTEFVAYLDDVLATLRGRGVTIERGLSEEECTATETHYGFVFPSDLRLFLNTALPVSPGFPNWRDSPHPALDEQLRWPIEGLCFDVEHTDLWLEAWGPKPPSVRDACHSMTRQVQQAPCLIPVCGHRYMPSEPRLAGNPVFSVWLSDIIYYGFDLAGYFTMEFAVPLPDWATRVPRPISFWDDFL